MGGRSRQTAFGRPSERSGARGGDRAVECARLENELGLKTHVGSNPTLPANENSALKPLEARGVVIPPSVTTLMGKFSREGQALT